MTTTRKILLVDDDSTVSDFYQLELSDEFLVETADSGHQALAMLAEQGPYAVAVADMHMPTMNGAEFLQHVQKLYPTVVRVMLSADNDQSVAVEAVNQGQIFRFLNKPCPAERLAVALRAGLEQHGLVMAEKELLAQTLNGSIQLLVEILSIVNPLACGRAMRVGGLVRKLCKQFVVENSWEISIAAMLSQVGCVSLPKSLLQKVQQRATLSQQEMELYASHPKLGHDLVSKIPRLHRIANIIALQGQSNDSPARATDDADSCDIAIRASFLRVALDYDELTEQGKRPDLAVREMCGRAAVYEPRVLRALAEVVSRDQCRPVREVSLNELREGMVLDADILDGNGTALITKGHEITQWLLERLRHQKAIGRAISEPIRVLDDGRTTKPPGAAPWGQLPSMVPIGESVAACPSP